MLGPGVGAAVPLGVGIGGPIGLGLSFAFALLATYAFAASRAARLTGTLRPPRGVA